MINLLTTNDIKYICRHMMGVDWVPSFIDIPSYKKREGLKGELRCQQEILRILSKCQSKLEVMYFLGIGYYLNQNGVENSTSDDFPSFWLDSVEGQDGIFVSEPFCGGRFHNGFSALLVVPQYKSPDKPIHHDFGMFISGDNGGGDWGLYAAVEIEGYGVHKHRRKEDDARYEGLSYKVIRVYEETSDPLKWYEIFDPDLTTGVPGEFPWEEEFGGV